MNLYVFPLNPGGKDPATRHGHLDATTDPDQIRAWWNEHPDYNIGVRPWPGVAVLDEDVSDGKPGAEELAALEAELGALPETWIAVTATGGRHIWLDVGADAIAARGVRKTIAPHIDVKVGATGYVVLPPSRRNCGTYRWLDADASGMPPGLPAAAPAAWRERILKPVPSQRQTSSPRPPAAAGTNPEYVATVVREELEKLAAAIPHNRDGSGRNATLIAVACRLFGLAKGGHLDSAAAAAEMRRIATELGLPDQEITTVLNSAWGRTSAEHPPARSPIPAAYSLEGPRL